MADGQTEPGAEAAYPRDSWHAAIASSQLADKPIAVRALDARLALFRDAEGHARAVQDRCAHRGVALHLGEVKEGALACPYHGWRYGGDGACVHIPSLVAGAEIAKGVGVKGYPCAEADGYVWVWMGQGAPDAPPQPIAEFDRFNWVQGSLTLACEALAVIENNIDWCHPVFAHPYTHGMFFMNQALGFQDQAIELRRTNAGLVVFQPPTASDADPVPTAPPVRLEYELPGRVTVATEVGPAGPMRIVMHMIPTGPGMSRQEWLVSTGLAEGPPQIVWSPEPNIIFEQDRALLESAQPVFDTEGHAFERSVEADAPTLMARRLYAMACGERQDGAALPTRRVLHVRT